MENKFLKILFIIFGIILILKSIPQLLTFSSMGIVIALLGLGYILLAVFRENNIFGVLSLIISVIAFLTSVIFPLTPLNADFGIALIVGWTILSMIYVSLFLLVISFIKN